MTDLSPSRALLFVSSRWDINECIKWSLLLSDASGVSEVSERVVTGSKRLTQDRTPLQGSIFGLGLASKCVVTMTLNLRAGFLFKEVLLIQAEKERHLHCIRTVERLQPCCAQNNWFLGWKAQLLVYRFKLGRVWNSAALGRAGEGRHLPVTCRFSPLTSHFRYTRPLRSVWSVPQRLGTFITHWLWTFISQAAGKEATDFRYENKTNTIYFLNYVITPPPTPFRCSLTHLLMISRNCMSIY